MLLTLAVVLPTPHDYSGTFQGGYSARFIASRRVLEEQEGFCTLQNSLKRTLLSAVLNCFDTTLWTSPHVMLDLYDIVVFLINTGSQMFTSTCLFHGIKMHDHQ